GGGWGGRFPEGGTRGVCAAAFGGGGDRGVKARDVAADGTGGARAQRRVAGAAAWRRRATADPEAGDSRAAGRRFARGRRGLAAARRGRAPGDRRRPLRTHAPRGGPSRRAR